MDKISKLSILPLILVAVCVISRPADADTSIYVFDPGQSIVTQTGGFAGIHETYSIIGQYRLTVDSDSDVALFETVDANLADETGAVYGQSLDEIFNMTGLAGIVIDEMTIQFEGKTADGTESDVRLMLSFMDGLAHMTGNTTPPPNSADMFFYDVNAVAIKKYAGGTGEPNDPYQIATAEDLMLLGETPEDYDKHFILIADIDLDPNLPGRKVFEKAVIAPGVNDSTFTGIFVGDGHTISHLTITGESYLGLFGRLSNEARLSNLGLEEVDINGTGSWVSGLVGVNEGDITQCYSTGWVNGDDHVGGLVGQNFAKITASYSSGSVRSTWSGVGGLIGENFGIVAYCYSTTSVAGSSLVGGLIGNDSDGILVQCYSTGAVDGSGNYVGGLVGSNYESDITSCFWDVRTSGQSTSAGGTGKATIEMQDANTFIPAGWDFIGRPDGPHDIWAEPEDGGYPILWWQVSPLLNLPAFSGGTGELNDPYLISTPEQLKSIGHNPRLMECHFRLAEDLDMSGIPFYPIGSNWLYSYRGVFNGDGHTISNLTIEGGGNLGLFNQLDCEGEINNLGVVDVEIAGSDAAVGGLVGLNIGNVTRCYVTGSISSDTGPWPWGVGGLVGYNYGNVSQCYTCGTVRGGDYVGGLVGENNGDVIYCLSTCAVSGGKDVGGLVGWNLTSIATSYSTGPVSGNSCIGGLVGTCTGISGEGRQVYPGTILNCYSRGTVDGSEQVGGLVGYSWSADPISGFWDMETSGQVVSAGGEGKTTAEMQTATTFLDAGWDFVDETANGTEDIWSICEGTNYPRFVWQIPMGDFVCPDGVAIEDFAFFMEHWLDDNCDPSNGYCEGTDLNQSGKVDVLDLEIFFENWPDKQ